MAPTIHTNGVHHEVDEAIDSLYAWFPPQPPAPLPEAPASVNVRVTVAGREVQWTLRDTDEARLAARLEALLARYPPPPARPGGLQPAPQPGQGLVCHPPNTHAAEP
jgi:hypothetical protein